MIKMNFTPFPELTTDRLNLRQITFNDMNEFFILKSDERLLKNYDAKTKTYNEARQFLYKLNDGISKNEWINWGIALKDNNKLIGSICFWNISEEQANAEIGYELMVEWQGKGIMQEAIKSIIQYGFSSMKLQLIEAVPNPDHLRSINLLEKNDFKKGAYFTEVDPTDGKILKRIMYTLENKRFE
jgi:[ribosomal protein S5]-alanine N-acetyltransferase